MKLGIMQPYFFPYIGYFQLIQAVDQFFLYDALDYSKEGWINRNRILVVHGRPMFLSVPIKDRRATKIIRDVELLDGSDWRTKQLRSIHRNYRRAPYFREVEGPIEEILFLDTFSLSELNKHCIVRICDFLDIETEILTDSRPFDELENRLRNKTTDLTESFPNLFSERPQRKVIRALELCRTLGAKVFINAIGGRDLYSKDVFAAHGVDVFFVSPRHHVYPQRSSSFYPRLSIIDVLMNCGRNNTRKLLAEYDLV